MLARLTVTGGWRWSRRIRLEPWNAIAALTAIALLVVAVFGNRIAPRDSIDFVLEHSTYPRPYDPSLPLVPATAVRQ